MKYKFIVCCLLFISFIVSAQDDQNVIQDILGVCDKVGEGISVEKGEKPNWKEFKKLFLPKAHIVLVNPPHGVQADEPYNAVSLNIRQLRRKLGKGYTERGFSTKSLGSQVDWFNNIAQVFQAYEFTYHDDDYTERGVATIQLVREKNRWLIASYSFSQETEAFKIPEGHFNKQYFRIK